MQSAERRFDEMVLRLARSIRKGNDPELARVAADWEIELMAKLNPPAQLAAEDGPAGAQRGE